MIGWRVRAWGSAFFVGLCGRKMQKSKKNISSETGACWIWEVQCRLMRRMRQVLNIAIKSSPLSTVERISQNKSISFGFLSTYDLKGVTSIKLSQSLCHDGTKRNLKTLEFVNYLELEEISAASQNNEESENLEYFFSRKSPWVEGVHLGRPREKTAVSQHSYVEYRWETDC